MSRIFISYRSADGTDKATALARDLGAVFGDEQVFLDKEDLRGGCDWRDEISRTLGQRPILLMLITPMCLGARDADGRLRIERDDDPVRREFSAALEAGALIIPLLCDGLDGQPEPQRLPPPLDRIGERTWRKLRAYDWKHDVQRLVDDLVTAGVQRRTPEGAPAAPARRTGTHAGWWALASMAVAAAAGLALQAAYPGDDEPVRTAAAEAGGALQMQPTSAGRPAPAASAPDLNGTWLVRGEDSAMPGSIDIRHDGGQVTLTSQRVPISGMADWVDWAEYRQFWKERTGETLNEIVYRGEGSATFDPVLPDILDVALQVVSASGAGPLDTGNLHLTIDADGQRMSGELWLNSQQAAEKIVLVPRG